MERFPDRTFISYREPGADHSTFIDVNKVLSSRDVGELERIYEGILHNLTRFESDSTSKLEAFEEGLFTHLIQLIKKDKQVEAHATKLAEIERIHNAFLHQFGHAKKGALPKETKPVLFEIAALKSLRLSDPTQELERLSRLERVGHSLKVIQDSLANSNDPQHVSLTIEQIIAIGHSIELREALKEQYIVVNHGQNLALMMLNIAAKKLKQMFEPKQYENVEILRHDVHLPTTEKRSVEWFKKRLHRDSDDHEFKTELISCDCYLESTRPMDSAIHFFATGDNVAFHEVPLFIPTVLRKILHSYFPKQELCEQLILSFMQMAREQPGSGALYSICIPHDRFDDVAYLSSAYGHPVQEKKYSKQDLISMQEGIPPHPHHLAPGVNKIEVTPPQVRLITERLNLEDSMAIVCHSTLSQQQLQKLEEEIELWLKKALLMPE